MIDASQLSPQQLVAIIEIQNAIARSRFDLGSVMSVVVERAMELTAAHGAVVELVDGDAMLYRAACGSVAQFVGLRIARSGSLAGLCIDQGVALHAPDTSVDDRVDRAACKRVGAAAMVCVPLFHAGHTVGVLKVVSSRPHAFGDATPVIVSLLADVIAASMHHALEYEAAVTLSLHDGLTGLWNRRAFDAQLAQEIARATRHGRPLSIAMFDLDGFKAINDTLGHAAGDDVLRRAGVILRRTFRNHDGCFRLGGDEFAALLPETLLAGAMSAAERYVAELGEAPPGDTGVGVSAGAAEFRHDETAIELCSRADAALYDHKRLRRAARLATPASIRPTRRLRPGGAT